MDADSIKFYTKSGKEYLTALQFKVLKIWKIKFGLLFEREVERKDSGEEIVDAIDLGTELPTHSLQSYMSFKNNSFGVRKSSMEPSVYFKQKNLMDFNDCTTFGSTQYLNLPPPNPEDNSSPFNSSSFIGTPALEQNSNNLPTIFSLSHPLDEICPVVVKEGMHS